MCNRVRGPLAVGSVGGALAGFVAGLAFLPAGVVFAFATGYAATVYAIICEYDSGNGVKIGVLMITPLAIVWWAHQ